jgi:hypothetical protein
MGIVNSSEVDTRRSAFIESLRTAYVDRRGPTPSVEVTARAFAYAMREDGVPIGRALVEVKDLIRAHTAQDEPLFTPKVVGWTVAGFFAGTSD